MAVSKIPLDYKRTTKTIQIEWASTSNPTQYATVDISESGYIPYAIAGYSVSGTLGSYVHVSAVRIDNNKKLYYECRMDNTPSSLTQNKLVLDIIYQRSS